MKSSLTPADQLVLIAMSIGLGVISYLWIENIFRRDHNPISNAFVARVSLTCSACLILVSALMVTSNGFVWRYAGIHREFLTKGANGFQKTYFGGDGCKAPEEGFVCNFGGKKNRHFVIGGDSHAEMYFAGFKGLSSKYDYSFDLYTEGTCGLFSENEIFTDDKKCKQARKLFQIYLQRHNENVVLVHRWKSYIEKNEKVSDFAAKTVNQLTRMLVGDSARGFNRKWIIVGQIPEMPGYGGVYSCVSRFEYLPKTHNCDETRESYPAVATNKLINIELKRKIEELRSSQILFVDPFESLCTNKMCQQINSQGLLYSDNNHLSISGSKFLISSIERSIVNFFRLHLAENMKNN